MNRHTVTTKFWLVGLWIILGSLALTAQDRPLKDYLRPTNRIIAGRVVKEVKNLSGPHILTIADVEVILGEPLPDQPVLVDVPYYEEIHKAVSESGGWVGKQVLFKAYEKDNRLLAYEEYNESYCWFPNCRSILVLTTTTQPYVTDLKALLPILDLKDRESLLENLKNYAEDSRHAEHFRIFAAVEMVYRLLRGTASDEEVKPALRYYLQTWFHNESYSPLFRITAENLYMRNVAVETQYMWSVPRLEFLSQMRKFPEIQSQVDGIIEQALEEKAEFLIRAKDFENAAQVIASIKHPYFQATLRKKIAERQGVRKDVSQ